MGTETRSKASSESQNWEHIFNAMVQMLQEQQSKLETMAKERKMLADRFRTEHEKWAFSVRLLQDEIAQVIDFPFTVKIEIRVLDVYTFFHF